MYSGIGCLFCLWRSFIRMSGKTARCMCVTHTHHTHICECTIHWFVFALKNEFCCKFQSNHTRHPHKVGSCHIREYFLWLIDSYRTEYALCCKYDRVNSHTSMHHIKHSIHIWMVRVTLERAFCCTHSRVTSHTHTCQSATSHTPPTYGWVMSLLRMLSVANMDASCRTYQPATTYPHSPHMDRTCHIWKRVHWQIWMSHVTHINHS